MSNARHPAPMQYKGVMVSSTFTDLKEHRAALIKAIEAEQLKSVAMEHDAAKPDGDVIDSSYQMVRDAAAYIGVISRKYGQIPECPQRNSDGLSLTQLEFQEARRLQRPVLLFIMGDQHPVREADVEMDPDKRQKLASFREDAKRPNPDSAVHRVYKTFDDLDQFKGAAIQSIAELRRHLDAQASPPPQPAPEPAPAPGEPAPIPRPPAFYAEPSYIGSHQFIGRQAQLDVLDDWAAAADPHPVLLFDAIGGAGKSMLTWEWTTRRATQTRDDWTGCFWYSFYERGAIMADFCRRALAYITGQPLKELNRKRTPELSAMLLRHLQDSRWLFILDGLERVLVAYHRFDAAQLTDEEADKPTDQIAQRDPCAAIRPEDDDLLRALAGAAPSKLLVTSRLVPRVLHNQANQPIPGVRRESLPGLRPAEAEALLRACGVSGDSQTMQDYLTTHCDCHPLVTGVLAGLVTNYLPDRGHFDAWAAAPDSGGQLDLAELDLVQKRNHILTSALDALPEKSRQLLSTLALLSEAVDYPTLSALNPHLPPEPEKVAEPDDPEHSLFWNRTSDADKKKAQQEYQATLQRRKEYEQAVEARRLSPEFLAAPGELTRTVSDLENRGLLQYDPQTKRHDLHPVVRGVAAGGLKPEEREQYGQRAVDYFSAQEHNPYEEAETLEDLSNGLHIVRALLAMGRYEQAYEAYRGDLADALFFNLEANAEVLSLLRPFFPHGWSSLPNVSDKRSRSYLANDVGIVLDKIGERQEALAAIGNALIIYLVQEDWASLGTNLTNISVTLSSQNRLAKQERCLLLALDLGALMDVKENLFRARLFRFRQLANIGQWTEAEAMWQLLDPMGRDWNRALYRPGNAEHEYALYRFYQGTLEEDHLIQAEQLAATGNNRAIIRSLHGLRGEWHLQQGQSSRAVASFHEAVRMARAVGISDPSAETQLVLARFHLDQLADPRHEAEQLASAGDVSHLDLADLWLAIGDREQAHEHALAAYKRAWADGEPYVRRYNLDKARALLEQLGADIPDLPPYDPARDEKLAWEDEVVAAIEKLRAEKEAEESAESDE